MPTQKLFGQLEITAFCRAVAKAIVVTVTLCFATTFVLADPPHDGEPTPYPGEDDPSHFTGPEFGDLPEGLPEAHGGAFVGGNTGTGTDAGESNVLQADGQRDDGTFNVPTNGPPSPLFGAEPFTQPMLRFEEFGTQSLDLNGGQPGNWQPLPAPVSAQSTPDSEALEDFLANGIWPVPTQFANDADSNPWQSEIEGFLGRLLDDPPAEGRPPGLGWSHQRWDEFTPEVYYQTATAGARTNGGFRDGKQRHGYSAGEFGKKGLYHNPTGHNGGKYKGTTEGIEVR